MPEGSELVMFNRFADDELFITKSEIEQSARWIEALQLDSGLIPWHVGGHIDPWNHIESVIAMAIGGRRNAVVRGLDGLANLQNRDGSFCHFYLYNGVKEADRDPNVICYLGVGMLALLSIYGLDLVKPYVQILIDAVDYVVTIQREDGLMPALMRPEGTEKGRPLRAANCSIMTSLEASIAFARVANLDARKLQSWNLSLTRLRRAYEEATDDDFAATEDWAMDWYYPVLALAPGAGQELTDRFSIGLKQFFEADFGVKCKASNSWFTAAETAEAAIAALILGNIDVAREIYSTLRRFRSSDGGYVTGIVEPYSVTFPPEERSSYTTAAVIIASAMLSRGSKVSSFKDALCSLGY
ncbi:MAG: hypothetical protein M0019_08380 [Actinomycetota bacterium]|nr:hypothetical protein [Actinomycetota bacterium]